MRIKLDSNSNIINLKHSLVKLFSDIRCHYYTLGKYWQLIRFMVSGEFKSDLFKTFLGDAWLLIDPLTRMTVYYFLLIVLSFFSALNVIQTVFENLCQLFEF